MPDPSAPAAGAAPAVPAPVAAAGHPAPVAGHHAGGLCAPRGDADHSALAAAATPAVPAPVPSAGAPPPSVSPPLPGAGPVGGPRPRALGAPSGAEAGQATVLVALAVVLAAVVVAALVPRATVVVDGARARTAADAAALAGAADGREAAAEVARANGAVVVGYGAEGHDVVVTVAVGRARAAARARREGSWCTDDGPGAVTIPYTRPSCPSSPG